MDANPAQMVAQARERMDLQDYFGAIHLLEDVVSGGRAYADAYQLLGLAYSMAGQRERALEYFDRAVQLNPRYVEALIHKAIILNELGREDDAKVVFDQARRVGEEQRDGFPVHIASKLANQHAALGEAYAEAGGVPRAIEQYQQAVALGPAFYDLRYRLGRLLLEAGRALDAREQFDIIVRERPSWLDAAALLGLACYLAGDGMEARRVWEACRERQPEDARVAAYLAMLERAGA